METSAPLVDGIVNNDVSLQLTHRSDAASNHSPPAFFSGRLDAPDFVINWIEVRVVRRPEIWKFIQVSYIIALSDWRQP